MHSLFNFAYLDAGTGSLVIQSIVGIVAGIAVFGRRAISRVSQKFTSIFHKTKDNSDS